MRLEFGLPTAQSGLRTRMSLRMQLLRVVLVIGVPVLALGFLPGRASAANQTVPLTFAGSGSNTDVLSVLGVCDECAPDAFFTDPTNFINTWGFGANATVQAQASWADPSSVALQYSPTNLRHGATLDLADTLTPGPGTMTVNYSVSGLLGLYGSPDSGSLTCAVVTDHPDYLQRLGADDEHPDLRADLRVGHDPMHDAAAG